MQIVASNAPKFSVTQTTRCRPLRELKAAALRCQLPLNTPYGAIWVNIPQTWDVCAVNVENGASGNSGAAQYPPSPFFASSAKAEQFHQLYT